MERIYGDTVPLNTGVRTSGVSEPNVQHHWSKVCWMFTNRACYGLRPRCSWTSGVPHQGGQHCKLAYARLCEALWRFTSMVHRMFMFPLLLLSTSTQGTPDVQNEHPIHPASVNFLYVFLLAQKLSKIILLEGLHRKIWNYFPSLSFGIHYLPGDVSWTYSRDIVPLIFYQCTNCYVRVSSTGMTVHTAAQLFLVGTAPCKNIASCHCFPTCHVLLVLISQPNHDCQLLTSNIVMNDLTRLSCQGCHVMAVLSRRSSLSQLYCLRYFAAAILTRLHCHGFPITAFQSRLTYPSSSGSVGI
jgi:hypothetical protein